MDVRLNERQHDLLRRIVDGWISDLKMEISDTEDFEFRRGLKEDKEAAISILEQLDADAARRYRSAS
jgi:hypothetical protein